MSCPATGTNWPTFRVGGTHEGTIKVDWRRHFGWGVGMDHQFESEQLGKGLLKVYYNDLKNRTEPDAALPRGADEKRYRFLWRHTWQPLPDTTVITDIQEFSDGNFRKDFLFREEFTDDDLIESFISSVTSTPHYTLSAALRKRMNRFQDMTEARPEALPEVELDIRQQRIGETQFFSQTKFGVANLQTKTAHSDVAADVVRVDWFEQLSYAVNWFRPIELTPRAGVRQTYYTKDIQGTGGREGNRDVLSGQFSMGADASLKFFRIFPITTNAWGLNLNLLRHVITPTLGHTYVHQPTVPNSLLNFAARAFKICQPLT